MKKFNVPCQFGNQSSSFTVYIGDPKPDNNPLQHQAEWLSSNRGGSINSETMGIMDKMHGIANKDHLSFEEVFVYSINLALQKEENDKNKKDSSMNDNSFNVDNSSHDDKAGDENDNKQ